MRNYSVRTQRVGQFKWDLLGATYPKPSDADRASVEKWVRGKDIYDSRGLMGRDRYGGDEKNEQVALDLALESASVVGVAMFLMC